MNCGNTLSHYVWRNLKNSAVWLHVPKYMIKTFHSSSCIMETVFIWRTNEEENKFNLSYIKILKESSYLIKSYYNTIPSWWPTHLETLEILCQIVILMKILLCEYSCHKKGSMDCFIRFQQIPNKWDSDIWSGFMDINIWNVCLFEIVCSTEEGSWGWNIYGTIGNLIHSSTLYVKSTTLYVKWLPFT